MCWKCNNPDGSDEDYLDVLRAAIDDHRWTVHYVEDARRPFAYTVGLQCIGYPELLIMGMPAQTSSRLLNSLAHQMVDDDMRLRPGVLVDYQSEFLLEIVEVDHPDVHLKWAVRLFGARFRALQLVWADDDDRWPWDRGWNQGQCWQPVLGRRPAPIYVSHG